MRVSEVCEGLRLANKAGIMPIAIGRLEIAL